MLATAVGYTTPGVDEPNDVQGAVVAYAESQIGIPYAFGGTDPQTGFDCSGLVVWAYGLAGVVVPRVAEDQWKTEPHVATDDLVPGDLVFFGAGGDAEHVGIYVGDSAMIDAPHTGADVRIETFTDVVGCALGQRGTSRCRRPGGSCDVHAAHTATARDHGVQPRLDPRHSIESKQSSGRAVQGRPTGSAECRSRCSWDS